MASITTSFHIFLGNDRYLRICIGNHTFRPAGALCKTWGNYWKFFEQHEEHLHTVSPEVWIKDEKDYNMAINLLSRESTLVFYKNTTYDIESDAQAEMHKSESDILYFAEQPEGISELSLVPAERSKLARLMAYQTVPKDKKFIVKLVYDLVDNIDLPEIQTSKEFYSPMGASSLGTAEVDSDKLDITRQYGQEQISSRIPNQPTPYMPGNYVSKHEAEVTAREIRRTLQEKVNNQIVELSKRSTHKSKSAMPYESSLNITADMKKTLESKSKSPNKADKARSQLKSTSAKKSNLKNMGIQTDTKSQKIKDGPQKVQISESKTSHVFMTDTAHSDESIEDQETQTSQKEKQD